jgi:hypothetical protein
MRHVRTDVAREDRCSTGGRPRTKKRLDKRDRRPGAGLKSPSSSWEEVAGLLGAALEEYGRIASLLLKAGAHKLTALKTHFPARN